MRPRGKAVWLLWWEYDDYPFNDDMYSLASTLMGVFSSLDRLEDAKGPLAEQRHWPLDQEGKWRMEEIVLDDVSKWAKELTP